MKTKSMIWRNIRLCNFALAILCVPIVLVAGPSWVAMIDCVILGALLASTYFIGHIIDLQTKYEESLSKLVVSGEINAQLIRAYYVNRRHVNENNKLLETPK